MLHHIFHRASFACEDNNFPWRDIFVINETMHTLQGGGVNIEKDIHCNSVSSPLPNGRCPCLCAHAVHVKYPGTFPLPMFITLLLQCNSDSPTLESSTQHRPTSKTDLDAFQHSDHKTYVYICIEYVQVSDIYVLEGIFQC